MKSALKDFHNSIVNLPINLLPNYTKNSGVSKGACYRKGGTNGEYRKEKILVKTR